LSPGTTAFTPILSINGKIFYQEVDMMSKRFYWLIVITAFIASFAVTTQHKEVFAGGVADITEESCKHKSIALIFPDDTSRAITNAQDYNRKTGADVMDVKAIFGDLTAAFQKEFKSVVRVEKMENVKALNVDLVAVLDLQYTIPDTVERDVRYEVSATIITPAQVRVDIIGGSSVKSPASFPEARGAKRIADAIKVAAIESEYRMVDELHSSTKIAAFCGSNKLPEKGASLASPPQTTAGKSGLSAGLSTDTTSTAPSSEQMTTAKTEVVTSPPSKKAHRKHTAKRTTKAKPSPFSEQMISATSSTQTATVTSHPVGSSSSKETVEVHAPAKKTKASSKTKANAFTRKASAAPSPAPEHKRTGKSGVSKSTSLTVTPDKNAYAVVIGVEQYRQKLPKAEFASHDAQAMSELLTKAMGYPAENVITLINNQATNADLSKYIEKWLLRQVKTGGTVFIYFSGLGTSDPETGDVFLVPYDGDPSFIDQTAYSLKRMNDALRKLPAKEIIVVLDSCFSGAGGKSVPVEGARSAAINLQKSLVPSKNMTVLAAASGDQSCSSYQAKGHSLFTYYLLNGIKNEDVILQDGSLDLGDLFSYVQPQVERVAKKKNNSAQSPQLIELKNN
jgi:hypothetical protein